MMSERVKAIIAACEKNLMPADDGLLSDDMNAYDISGGNYDDAMSAGQELGAHYLAKEILALIITVPA